MTHANKLSFIFLLAVTTVHARANAQSTDHATVGAASVRADARAHEGNDFALKRSIVPAIVLGAVGDAALMAGVGLVAGWGAKKSTAQGDYSAILAAHQSCVTGAANYNSAGCASLYSTASTGNTLQYAGIGALVGAGAAAVGTVIYLVLPSSSATAPSRDGLRLMPALSPASAGLLFAGTF